MDLKAAAIALSIWPKTVGKLVDQKYDSISENIAFYFRRL
jgi:hypothetical protein